MSKGPKTVLIVDDSALFLKFERSLLEPCGCRVREAASSAEALVCLREEQVDLLLLDPSLPDRSGDDLSRIIKGMPGYGSLPVIMVAASGQFADAQRCSDAGCGDFITKPINANLLCRKVGNALGVPVRSPLFVPIQVKMIEEKGQWNFFGYTRDVSESGISLTTNQIIPVGSRLEIEFRYPDTARPVSAVTQVRRVRPHRRDYFLGVSFEEIAEADRGMIKRFVESRLPEEAA